MGKYLNLDQNILAIFGSASWLDEGISVYPVNFVAMNAGSEFLKVSVIPSGSGVNLNSVSGVMIVDIFVASGTGPSRASEIADKLDTYLSGNAISPAAGVSIQLGSSSVRPLGLDPDNSSLYRTSYTIPFNYFEVM